MKKEIDALQILKLAREKIRDPRDWGKRGRPDRENFASCCAAEAIEECLGSSLELIPLFAEKRRALRVLANAAGVDGERFQNIVEWNDAPERTHREVIAAFNLAIATLRL